VRLQTMPRPKPGEPPMFRGALDCVKQTIAKEGFFALYKGMAAPLAGVSPLFAVFFAGCAVGRHLQTTHPDQEMTFIQNMNSGALAGVFTTIVMVPGERIKCLLQVQSHGHAPSGVHYDGPLDVVKKLSVCIPADVLKSRLQTAPEGKYPDGIRGVFKEVMREEGPRALFKGFTPVMLRAFPANAACFFGLELTLALFRLLGVGVGKAETIESSIEGSFPSSQI
ncbi:hypothetical protein TELCIR_12801, partial [Teladorsagia circumcincta]